LQRHCRLRRHGLPRPQPRQRPEGGRQGGGRKADAGTTFLTISAHFGGPWEDTHTLWQSL